MCKIPNQDNNEKEEKDELKKNLKKKFVQKREKLCTSGSNVNWCRNYGKQHED